MKLRSAFLGAGLMAIATGAIGLAQTNPGGGPPTPPPPPLPNTVNRTPTPITTPVPSAAPSASAVPTGSPAGRGRKGRGPSDQVTPSPGASPTETPVPPQFSSLDGTWEVQLQPRNSSRAIYSHLVIVQTGNDLAGTWNKDAKTRIPFKGTFDGRLFKLTLNPGATEMTMSGYEENFGDMVGVVDDGKTRTAFTASHRKKVKFNEEGPNIGLPGVGGSR